MTSYQLHLEDQLKDLEFKYRMALSDDINMMSYKNNKLQPYRQEIRDRVKNLEQQIRNTEALLYSNYKQTV